jgi:uncharacterized protein with PIN domain
MNEPQPPTVFFCDAMLGGLARWLRAAGYDAFYQYGIDDRELLRLAREGGGMVLSSDGPMFERNVIRSGEIPALYVPQQLSRGEQFRFVLRTLHLPLLAPRCMACGGELVEVPKHEVAGEAPPLAYRYCEQFWRCGRCHKLFWRGTHWTRITRLLEETGDAEIRDATLFPPRK